MQLEIIYVNKSTILAVDYKMKEEINKIINYSLIHNELNKLNQLNIFFVSEAELYSDIIKRENVDQGSCLPFFHFTQLLLFFFLYKRVFLLYNFPKILKLFIIIKKNIRRKQYGN